jgi:hypothetical protein
MFHIYSPDSPQKWWMEPVANSAGIPGSQHHFEMAEIAGTVAAHLQLSFSVSVCFLSSLTRIKYVYMIYMIYIYISTKAYTIDIYLSVCLPM